MDSAAEARRTQVRQGAGAPAAARQETELLPGERNLLLLLLLPLRLFTVGQYHYLHKKIDGAKVEVPQPSILSLGQQETERVLAKRDWLSVQA